MARLFGAATPRLPSAAVPHRPKPVRHWNDDSPSAPSRASRHQGPPPVPIRHNPSNDHAGLHEFDAAAPAAHEGRHQRRNIGSRPAMYGRPRAMPVAAAAATASVAKSAEQPAVPSQPESNRAETHTEVAIGFFTFMMIIISIVSQYVNYKLLLL